MLLATALSQARSKDSWKDQPTEKAAAPETKKVAAKQEKRYIHVTISEASLRKWKTPRSAL